MVLLVNFGAELVEALVKLFPKSSDLLRELGPKSAAVFCEFLLSCGILHPLFFALLQEDIATRLHRRPQFKLSNRGLRHT